MTQAIINNIFNNEQISLKKDYSDKNLINNPNKFEQIFDKTQNNISDKKTDITKENDSSTTINKQESNDTNDSSEQNKVADISTANSETTEESTEKNTTKPIEEIKEFIENTIFNNNSEDSETISNEDEIITEDSNENENEENETTTDQIGEDNLNINDSNLLENITNTIQTIIPNIDKNSSNNTTDTNISTEETNDELNVSINGESLDVTLKNFGIDENSDENLSNQITNLTKKEVTTQEEDIKTLDELVDEDTLRDLNIESIETESGEADTSSSDLMQNQTPEEQGIKAMMNIDGDFADIKVDTVKNTTNNQISKPSSPTELGPSKIIEQISKQLEGLNNSSKVNIVLNPESLGKVSVQLINTKEGLSAQFTVASQEARNLIMKGLDGLKDTLMAHGVSVDNVTVKMNETQESGYQADWTEQEGSRGGNKEQNSNREQKEQQKFDEMMSLLDSDENGKV